eukprot:sb/3464916/
MQCPYISYSHALPVLASKSFEIYGACIQFSYPDYSCGQYTTDCDRLARGGDDKLFSKEFHKNLGPALGVFLSVKNKIYQSDGPRKMDGIVTVSEFNNLKQDLHSIQDTIAQVVRYHSDTKLRHDTHTKLVASNTPSLAVLISCILNQMIVRIGTLDTKSWKLRDESGDLPIQVLSNKCQYFSSDLHSTRASHIMLLELIVDRLAFMLQYYVFFTERLVGKSVERVVGKAPNLGPLCKQYWKKTKNLRQFVASLETESDYDLPGFSGKGFWPVNRNPRCLTVFIKLVVQIQRKTEELVGVGLTLEQTREENVLLRDMMVKHGLAPGARTPRTAGKGRPPTAVVPPQTAGSTHWSEFSVSRKGEEEEMADSAVDVAPSSTSLVSQVRLPTQITVNNMKTVSKWLMQVGQSVDAKTQTVETSMSATPYRIC